VSGSLDCCARVWHIPSHGVAAAVDLPECITSAVFSPDGCLAAFGSFGGHLYFFRAGVTGESDSIGVDLEQIMQLQVAKTSRGDDPCKITAIKFRPGSDLSDVYEVLLTTNDSRIRLYKLDKTGGASAITRSLKISGHRNISSRFGATFSADGQYVMCGSEDSSVYIWAVTTDPDSKHPDVQHRWERFAVAGVTAAIWGWGPDPGFITASNQGAIDCFVVSR
jgi:WD40 repeat protein